MILDLQFKIKNNEAYKRFIRENSYWYKILNRDPLAFRFFENEVKERYKLRPVDRISKINERLNMLRGFMEVIR